MILDLEYCPWCGSAVLGSFPSSQTKGVEYEPRIREILGAGYGNGLCVLYLNLYNTYYIPLAAIHVLTQWQGRLEHAVFLCFQEWMKERLNGLLANLCHRMEGRTYRCKWLFVSKGNCGNMWKFFPLLRELKIRDQEGRKVRGWRKEGIV